VMQQHGSSGPSSQRGSLAATRAAHFLAQGRCQRGRPQGKGKADHPGPLLTQRAASAAHIAADVTARQAATRGIGQGWPSAAWQERFGRARPLPSESSHGAAPRATQRLW